MQQSLLVNFGEIFTNLFNDMGFVQGNWQNYVMLLISFVLMYLAIVKKFEPMLLLPIAFGMFLINIPGAEAVLWGRYTTPDTSLNIGKNGDIEYVAVYVYNGARIYLREGFLTDGVVTYFKSLADLNGGITSTMNEVDFNALYSFEGYIQGNVVNGVTEFIDSIVMSHTYESVTNRGLLWYLYFGVEKVIYPPLIFLGIGAMTDFGPLIANPKSMLIGAGAQLGIFVAFILASVLGFSAAAAAAIAIIGGADGPTAIMVTSKLASDLIPAIAIAAYSYMALIPIIQKPLMRALTTKKERLIRMKPLSQVSKLEKIL